MKELKLQSNVSDGDREEETGWTRADASRKCAWHTTAKKTDGNDGYPAQVRRGERFMLNTSMEYHERQA